MADGTLGMELAVEGIALRRPASRASKPRSKRCRASTEARLNFTNRRLHVAWYATTLAEPAAILHALEDSGYHGHPFVPSAPSRQRLPRRAG